MRVAGNFTGDIFLDNFPIVNLNPIIVEGALLAIVGGVILILWRPAYLIFTIKAVALFIAIRAFFVAATHLGIYPGQISPGDGFADRIYSLFTLEAGFFFSAHTGLPLLMAIIFWKDRFWRTVFLVLSLTFGVSVLLAHVHYSIDVFAAPFMTFSIFKMTQYLFPKDFQLIEEE